MNFPHELITSPKFRVQRAMFGALASAARVSPCGKWRATIPCWWSSPVTTARGDCLGVQYWGYGETTEERSHLRKNQPRRP